MATLRDSRLGELLGGIATVSGVACFVETGRGIADTARWAADRFERVVTIEPSETPHTEAGAALSDRRNVQHLHGGSAERLLGIASAAKGPTLYWLDTHCSIGQAAGEGSECPLLAELEAIGEGSDDIIVVDGAHLFLLPPPAPYDASHWPDLTAVVNRLQGQSHRRYVFCFEDALIAVPLAVRDHVARFLRGERLTDEPADEPTRWLRALTSKQPDPSVLRLHLGCGATRLDGYVNVDFPSDRHNVMDVRPDVEADLLAMELPDECVDEIRLHHVFEHFSRVDALVLLIRWHRWLKPGGRLRIETPDFEGSTDRCFSPSASYAQQAALVRHLVGDQAAHWAYHIDQWWEQRFRRTLEPLGFAIERVDRQAWPHWPHLANIDVVARKERSLSLRTMLEACDRLLWDSTVADAELSTHSIWRAQLYSRIGLTPGPYVPEPRVLTGEADMSHDGDAPVSRLLERNRASISDEELLSMNSGTRDEWVAQRLRDLPAGSRVLDVGAGTCPYRALLAHCDYVAQDFCQYEGLRDGSEGRYGEIDVVSSIENIPLPDESFDAVLCTEVLEHVPEPVQAIREMARLLKTGGVLLLTAPLGSGLHQLPHHYYGGFTPTWYRHFLPAADLDLIEIAPNGGFFKLLAQETHRARWLMPPELIADERERDALWSLLGDRLPRFYLGLEQQAVIDTFTIGYHVLAIKRARTTGDR